MSGFLSYADMICEEDVVQQVLKQNPNEEEVRHWYRHSPIDIFNGMTPQTLVARGYGQDLMHYLTKVQRCAA